VRCASLWVPPWHAGGPRRKNDFCSTAKGRRCGQRRGSSQKSRVEGVCCEAGRLLDQVHRTDVARNAGSSGLLRSPRQWSLGTLSTLCDTSYSFHRFAQELPAGQRFGVSILGVVSYHLHPCGPVYACRRKCARTELKFNTSVIPQLSKAEAWSVLARKATIDDTADQPVWAQNVGSQDRRNVFTKSGPAEWNREPQSGSASCTVPSQTPLPLGTFIEASILCTPRSL
jgi:hypothetical protein